MANIGQYGYQQGQAYSQKSALQKQNDALQYSQKTNGSSKDLFSYLLVFDSDKNGQYSDSEIKNATGLTTQLDLSDIWDTDENGLVDIKEAYIGMSHLAQADGEYNTTITKAGRDAVTEMNDLEYRSILSGTQAQYSSQLTEWFNSYLDALVDVSQQTDKAEVESNIISDYQKLDLLPQLNKTTQNKPDVQMIANNSNHIEDGKYTEAGIKALANYAQSDLNGLEQHLKTAAHDSLTEDGHADVDELTAFYKSIGDTQELAESRAQNFMKAFDRNEDGLIDHIEHATSLALEDNPEAIRSKKAKGMVNDDSELEELKNLDIPDIDEINDLLPEDLMIDPNDMTKVDTNGDGTVDINDIPDTDRDAFVLDGKSTGASRLFLETALANNPNKVKTKAKKLHKQFQSVLGN